MSAFYNRSDMELTTLVGWAILGYIGPNIREINIEYTKVDNRLNILFFFNEPPTEDEINDASCAVTELIAQTDSINFDFKTIHTPYPNRITTNGLCVYRRYEPNPNPEPITWETLMNAAIQAMFGRIHPNMREISLIHHKEVNAIQIFVCFDTTPTIHQIRDIDAIIAEISGHFSNNISWDREIILLPFPAKFSKGEMCLYCRSETLPEDENPNVS